MAERLAAAGAVLKLPPQGMAQALEEGLAPLIGRGLVTADLQPVAAERALLAFYAASVPAGSPRGSPGGAISSKKSCRNL